MSDRLSPEREQEIRETHPGSWYDGPWTQGYAEDSSYCRVVHEESGTTLATLPDFAGPIALFIADAHDAIPELLAELDAVRAELAEAKLASHCQSVAAINGTRCALPIRHRGDHQNERRNHYWSDEFAAETEVAS